MASLIIISNVIGVFLGIVVCILGVILLCRLAMIAGLRMFGIKAPFSMAFHFLKRRLRQESFIDECESWKSLSATSSTIRTATSYLFSVVPPCVGSAVFWYLFLYRSSSHGIVLQTLGALTGVVIVIHAIWWSSRRMSGAGRTYLALSKRTRLPDK